MPFCDPGELIDYVLKGDRPAGQPYRLRRLTARQYRAAVALLKSGEAETDPGKQVVLENKLLAVGVAAGPGYDGSREDWADDVLTVEEKAELIVAVLTEPRLAEDQRKNCSSPALSPSGGCAGDASKAA